MAVDTASKPSLSSSPGASPAEAPSRVRAPRVNILGVGFDSLDLDEAISALEAVIPSREPHQVCLANAYTVSIAQHDDHLRSLLNRSAFVLADGMSIVWGARWIHATLPGRVAGPDLMDTLCARAAAKGYRVFLLGTTNDNLAQLAKTLTTDHPGLHIVGMHSPSFCEKLTAGENDQIIQRLTDAKPDILFVGMSAPKQEKWIDENLSRLPVPLAIGVGAAFDFLSGRIPRAPRFWQRRGLEWLYRLCCEPRRLWKRYLLGNAVYLGLLARQNARTKYQRTPPHS